MNALFDSAGLAIVAYAEVVGSTGASTLTNSGVTTTLVTTGVYNVVLPADKTQQAARDLIFIQVKGTSVTPVTSKVDDSDPTTKVVRITDATTLLNSDFSILILRTIIPPPAGAPA